MHYFIVLIAALFLSGTSSTLNAQVRAFNLESQPIWGPTGYDYVEYYYLPDIEAYYNVPQHRYYYYNNGSWITRSYLPSRFNNYDFYNSYKVVVNERDPWKNHKTYRNKYSSYKNRHDQQVIRDSRDSKYFVNKKHPEHQNWLKKQKHDNGKHKGWYKENDNKGSQKDNKQKSKNRK
jgi:hypothetical protein